jgi:hypothetical protein
MEKEISGESSFIGSPPNLQSKGGSSVGSHPFQGKQNVSSSSGEMVLNALLDMCGEYGMSDENCANSTMLNGNISAGVGPGANGTSETDINPFYYFEVTCCFLALYFSTFSFLNCFYYSLEKVQLVHNAMLNIGLDEPQNESYVAVKLSTPQDAFCVIKSSCFEHSSGTRVTG